MNKLVKTFLDLVQIDSPSGHEDKVRNYIVERLKSRGIDSSIDQTGNLFARVDGIGEPVILSCHMDTVEPGRGIKPVIVNGIIKSRGNTILGADNKVAVAAILEAVDNLKSSHRSLELVFSVREETDSGLSKFDFGRLKSKRGIVADSSSLVGTIITASPWITDLKIEVIGKSAHSSVPQKANNALIPAIMALSVIPLGKIDDYTTCNIGLISGGSATNTIPDNLILQGEVRGFSHKLFENALKKIKSNFKNNATSYGVELQYVEIPYSTGYSLEKSDEVVTEIASIFKSLKITTKYKESFGGSDANAFIKNGIKVVNIGDGSKNAHTRNESIKISELIRLGEFYNAYVHLIK